MSNSLLTGASLSNAHLEKADLTGGVQAQGANFLNASLQGADLTGAQLQLADFTSAAMQGAVLNFARLEGASLRGADLEAASLQQAKLMATDMTGMKMAGSDLRGAVIWMAQPPVWDTTGLSDLSELAVRAPDEAERAAMKSSMERISDDEVRRRAIEMVGSLAEKDTTWAGSIDQQRWQSWVGASPVPPALNYKVDLTNYLTKLMCSARWSNGAVATGIARRAVRAAVPRRRGRRLRWPQGQHLPGVDPGVAEGDEGSVSRRRKRPLLSSAGAAPCQRPHRALIIEHNRNAASVLSVDNRPRPQRAGRDRVGSGIGCECNSSGRCSAWRRRPMATWLLAPQRGACKCEE